MRGVRAFHQLSQLARRADRVLVAVVPVAVVVVGGANVVIPTANADNRRLNSSVVANVYTTRHQAACTTDLTVDPQLQLAAQWRTNDVMANRNLNADTGSSGSSAQGRANAAGYHGTVTETIAVNSALAISGIEILQQWYSNPAALAIMQNCANTEIGVWSENSLDRTVVVAVYGEPR